VKQIGNLVLTVIHQWKKAWEYRNNNITHDTTRQQNNKGYSVTDLDYLYDNKQDISVNNQCFLMQTKEEHKQKSTAQIKKWLHMQYQTMKTEIQQTIAQQHLDDEITLNSQNSIQERTENVPCDAYKAPLPGPSE
jgi:hypothetical protein